MNQLGLNCSTYPSPPILKSSNSLNSLKHSDSNHFLLSNTSRIYQDRIQNPKKIIPRETDAFPKFPAATNILFIPSDLYHSAKDLIQSIKNKDREGAQDAATSLAAVPANAGSSVGIIFDYGIGLNWLPRSLWISLKPTYILGIILCVIEGIIDTFGLSRQIQFSDAFDFKLLKDLKTLTDNESVVKGHQAFHSLLSFIEDNQKQMQQTYGKDETQMFLSYFKQIKGKLDAHPHFQKCIFDEHQDQIKEFARVILAKNLSHLQENYLQLNEKEVEKIAEKIKRKYENKPIEAQQEKLFDNLDKALNKKYKKLARRVRPWMVHEAAEITKPILMGLTSHLEENRDLAVKEGLNFMNTVRIQNEKKKLVYAIGITCLVVAAVSLIALMVGASYAMPLVLIIIATLIGTGRFLTFSGSLDVRGWGFSGRNILPHWLQKKIWSKPSLGDPETLSKRIVIPFMPPSQVLADNKPLSRQ